MSLLVYTEVGLKLQQRLEKHIGDYDLSLNATRAV